MKFRLDKTTMTVNASKVCDFLISVLKASHLNFYLQESPFAVNINVKKTFIKNHAGVEVLPDVDNFSCIKCQAADNNVVVKDTVGEDDEKYDKLNDTIHDLSCKLEKAKNELSETMEEKNDLAIQLKEAKNTLNEKTEKKYTGNQTVQGRSEEKKRGDG